MFGILLVCLSTASAQNASPGEVNGKSRPKIGLVLGGGAALGIAHAGILEWLEENRIPVDYVAGTSMGGLVGGAYATGMSGSEIVQLFSTLDWKPTLSPRVPYPYLSFRRKEDQRAYPSGLEFGWRGLPSGINPAPEVNLLLSRIASRVGATANFDDFPIPFRCTAIDITAGTPIVMGDGSLATALRATMAIPGLFTPVERNGATLVDGGFLNNVPSDVARTMGAEIVIAVSVTEDFQTQRSFGSLLGVLSRTQAVLSRESIERAMQESDLILRPDLKAFTIDDWSSAAAMIAEGRKIAEANADKLRQYALSETEWQAHLAARQARRKAEGFIPQFIEVTGVTGSLQQRFTEALQPLVGTPFDVDSTEEILEYLNGTGQIAALSYTPIQRDNQTGLQVIVVEKGYGPPLINFAPRIQSGQALEFATVLGARVTSFDVGISGSETRVDVGVGNANLASLEYFLPLNRRAGQDRTPFVALGGRYSDTRQAFFSQGERAADFRLREALFGVDLGLLSRRSNEWRVGFFAGTQRGSEIVGLPDNPQLSGSTRLFRLRYAQDKQNAPILPTRGLYTVAEAQHILRAPGTSESFNRVQASASWFFPKSSQETLFVGGSGGTNFSGTPSPFFEFTLGGITNLSAYQPGEIRGRTYLFGTMGYIRELSAGSFLLGGRTSAGVWAEVGNAWGSTVTQNDPALPTCVSGGLLVETVLGPILVGGSVGQGGRSRLFFSIGRFLN